MFIKIMKTVETEHTKEDEEEFRLARQMKELYCDKSGKETDSEKATEIIYKIGLCYRKQSPSKLALIKSIGLFNAAIVRNSWNPSQIKLDLSELCQHILQLAKANNQNADLIKEAERVKCCFEEMRTEVKNFLKSSVPVFPKNVTSEQLNALILEKVSAIQNINKIITNNYKRIMADLSQYCQDVMGKPPCDFAIVGMGSLARQEITPYSDFEHIILLFDTKNYEPYLEYFRWYSVIFHSIVLNLRETIIPSLNICSLNGKDFSLENWFFDNKTLRGISFDGMMPHACKFPLGRQEHTENKKFVTELIKPVGEMLQYLNSEADLKNGYHLADVLTKTTFVFGNEIIYNQFVDGASAYQNKQSQTDTIVDVQQQVKEDLQKFSTRYCLNKLKSQNAINIKQLVYRSTTIFIAALAKVHKISANSSFGIIEEMEKKNKITANTADKLRFAIAVACEMRLKTYMENNCQRDDAIVLKQEEDNIEKFLNIVGVVSTVRYFQIAYCLQCEVAKQLRFSKLHFDSNLQLMNATIGLAFGMSHLTSFSLEPHKQFRDVSEFNFDSSMEKLESEFDIEKCFSKNDVKSSSYSLLAITVETIADHLLSADVNDEALELYQQLVIIFETTINNKNWAYDLARANNQIGICKNYLNQPTEALYYLNQALTLYNKAKNSNPAERSNVEKSISITLHNIGGCYIDLYQYDDAIAYLNQALAIKVKTALDVDTDRDVAATYQELGRCHIHMQKHNEALDYLNQALRIKRITTLGIEKDRDFAITQCSIGRCLIELQQYENAWKCLKENLTIFENTTLEKEKDRRIADTFFYMGKWHVEKQQYANAQKEFEQALEIYKIISIDADKSLKLAKTLYNIGLCLKELQNDENALNHLNQSLAIYENLTPNQYTTIKIKSIRFKIDQIEKAV